MTIKVFNLTATALALAFLMGCTQNQILATLEASVAATETLVAALQVAGKIDTSVASEIESAIAGLPAAFRETASELSSMDAEAAKAAKIASYYASTVAALEVLPPEAQAYASAISASIHAFLSGLPQTQATRSLAPGGTFGPAPRTVADSGASATKFDAKRLNAIGSRAAVLEDRLGKLKAGSAKKSEESTR